MIFFSKPFGLNISDFSIELVSLSGNVKEPKLFVLGRRKLPPGVIRDGRVINKEKLKYFLREIISKPEFGKLKTKKFIFSISETQSFIHSCKRSDLGKNISEFVKKIARENFPFSLEEIFLDFEIEGEEVLVAALLKDVVKDYLEVFSECKIFPLVLEPESLSVGRTLIRGEKVTLICDIGSKWSHLSLFDKKKLKLSVSVEVAGNSFTLAISENLKIPFEEAERLKKEIGLNPREKEGRIFLILQREIQKLIDQIKEIENYYFKTTSEKIEKIILTGGSASLPYLKEYLKENLVKEILIGDPWEKINIDLLKKKEHLKKALRINPYLYSAALGSALRGIEKNPQKGINLIKK
jgi:type IV pilus assembly protein PilM